MALRLNSLKTRTALAMSAVIVTLLVANALYLILSKRAELRRGIERSATTFALLTRGPIGTAWAAYHESGVNRFRDLIRDLMSLNPDVERIQVVNTNGQVLFDTREGLVAPPGRTEPLWLQDPERLEAADQPLEGRVGGFDGGVEDPVVDVGPEA